MRKANLSDFEEIFNILESSFPEDEYRVKKGQEKLFEDPRYTVYVTERDGKIDAFIALWNLGAVVYGEHMAVRESVRNQGTGRKMLTEAAEKAKEEGKMFCLEVEPPEEEMAKRRIGLYEDIGFVLNEYPYMQPPLGEDRNAIPLMIMSYEKPLNPAEFESIKETLYREIYKVL